MLSMQNFGTKLLTKFGKDRPLGGATNTKRLYFHEIFTKLGGFLSPGEGTRQGRGLARAWTLSYTAHSSNLTFSHDQNMTRM